MTYALIVNGSVNKYPYSFNQLVKDNPNTSFPNSMSDEDLASWGVVNVVSTPEPEYNPGTQTLGWGQPIEEDGVWYHTWEVNDLQEEQINERLQAARENASLSPMQFRLNLLAMDELDNVEAAIPLSSREVQIMWEYASSFERLHPAILGLAEQLNYTDSQLDELFMI